MSDPRLKFSLELCRLNCRRFLKTAQSVFPDKIVKAYFAVKANAVSKVHRIVYAEGLGAEINVADHSIKIKFEKIKNTQIPFEAGAKSRVSSMFLGPLLARMGEAMVPNPGGCRLGARPIERHIEGLEKMGVDITYLSEDGYFHAKTGGLKGATYVFEKNTHTGSETLILAAVLAEGKTPLFEAKAEEAAAPAA